MRTHSLLWWTFNRLLLVVLLTTLLVIIYLNSVMREVARNHHADMLAMQVTAAQNVLLQHLASDETTPHDLNGLCQEIARTSGTRVSLIDNRGDVLGDSQLFSTRGCQVLRGLLDWHPEGWRERKRHLS